MLNTDALWDAYWALEEHSSHGLSEDGKQCKGWGTQDIYLCICGLRKAQEDFSNVMFQYEQEAENEALLERYAKDDQLVHLISHLV